MNFQYAKRNVERNEEMERISGIPYFTLVSVVYNVNVNNLRFSSWITVILVA